MAELFAYLAGVLLTSGVYLVLQRERVRALYGVVLIGNAVNLGVLAVGRAGSTVPPIIPAGALVPSGAVANPLPQALVLTALVISFGLTAFALALVGREAREDEAEAEAGAGAGAGTGGATRSDERAGAGAGTGAGAAGGEAA